MRIYLALSLGCMLVALVLLRVFALSTNVFDLGLFLTNFENAGQEWQRAFQGHSQPLMLLWGAGYQLLPAAVSTQVLVLLQAGALLASVAAVWRVYGALPGAAMLLYYPLWVNALFDFHFDHLAVPLLTAFFIGCEKRLFGYAAVAAAALVLIKEPFTLQTMACGLYFWWLAIYRREYAKRLLGMGAGLVLLGGAAFYVQIYWLIPYFTADGARFAFSAGAFSWLGSNPLDMLWNLLSKPWLVLTEMFGAPGKVAYIAVIFGSLMFVPLLRPAALIVALPLLMIALLSRSANYYSYANHYTAGVIVPAIVAFRDGLPAGSRYFAMAWKQVVKIWQPRPEAGAKWPVLVDSGKSFAGILLVWLVAGHWAMASSPISRLFWSDKVWSYSWRAYLPTERTTMIKQAILDYIPADTGISVSSQNTVNDYRLARRETYMPFPMGVDKPYEVMDWSNRSWSGLWAFIYSGEKPPARMRERFADYVVLDLRRPYFIADKGCEWIYGQCRDKAVEKSFLDWVAYARAHYDTVFERDGFMILKRRV